MIFAKSSDVYGREIVLKISSLMMFFSLLLVGYAQTPFIFFLSAVVYGFSYGMNTPTLQAWVIDLVSHENRGRGLATMFIGLESGIGVGALVSQWVYNNDITRIDLPFYFGAFMSLIAFIYLMTQKSRQKIF